MRGLLDTAATEGARSNDELPQLSQIVPNAGVDLAMNSALKDVAAAYFCQKKEELGAYVWEGFWLFAS